MLGRGQIEFLLKGFMELSGSRVFHLVAPKNCGHDSLGKLSHTAQIFRQGEASGPAGEEFGVNVRLGSLAGEEDRIHNVGNHENHFGPGGLHPGQEGFEVGGAGLLGFEHQHFDVVLLTPFLHSLGRAGAEEGSSSG